MMPKLAFKTAGPMFIAALLLTSATRAQERDPVAAQALFDEARTLISAKRYAEACVKLAESQRLDPGIGTQFNLADCHEHEGKLASAWAAFLEVESLAKATGHAARAETAGRRAALLAPRLPRLKIIVVDEARAPELEILRGGVVVREVQWGLALPLDPGSYRIEVTAPGRLTFASEVKATAGATVTFEVPTLEIATETTTLAAAPAPSARLAEPEPVPVAPAEPLSTNDAPVSEPSSSGPSALVIGLGLTSVVFLGAGSVLGIMASSKHEDSKDECPEDPNLCTDKGVELRDSAFLFAHLSTVGFIAGGAALTAAAILWLTAGEAEASSDAAVAILGGPEGAGLSYQGSF